jgi:hypothetical protein
VDSTQGLLKPEDMERLKALTRTLEEITSARDEANRVLSVMPWFRQLPR